MKLPAGLLDTNGKPAKGWIYLRGSDGEILQEFGEAGVNTRASCHALTSVGDNIEIEFLLNPNIAQFVDVLIDGVLRETASTKNANKVFKGHITKVWHQQRTGNGVGSERMGALKYCTMIVQPRNASKGLFSNLSLHLRG
jgi:hypothetical protein